MSRTTLALAGLIILGAAVLAAWSGPQAGDPAVLLRAAIEKEEVDGNLDAAIEQYKHIIKVAGANRTVAAQALLRLGGCYEKRGPKEARTTYEQLIRDYGEQSREVAAARQRLAALTAGAPTGAGDSRLSIRRVLDLDMYAKPSPDGKYLAFVDWKSGDLAILDVTTGATRALTKDSSFGWFSAWSRDSSRIACPWDASNSKEDRGGLRVVSLERDMPPRTIPIPGARWIEPHDWSPDGSWILCSYGPASGSRALALVSVGNGIVEKLDAPAGSGGWQYQFTTEGDAILYSAPPDGRAGPRDIFLRNLKTGATMPIVQHPAEDLLLGVLPGTDWLFFASDRRGRLDLWAVPFRQGKAAGQPVLVKQGLGRLVPLGFTNDGRYYYATLSATDDVFLADFDRGSGTVIGEARKLTSRWDGFSGFPSFSPDGGSLAYLVKRSPMPVPTGVFDSMVVQSLKDPTAEPLVVGFGELGLDSVRGPCWLPDAKAVVLAASTTQGEGSALFRVDLPNLRKTRIYSVATGRRLSGHVCASHQPVIYVGLTTEVIRIDVAGANEQRVFVAPQGQDISGMALSPDGRTLSFTTSLDRYLRALLVMPVEGGTPRQIHEFRQPSGGGVSTVWAPDGRSILYIVRSEERTGNLSFELRSVRVDGAQALPDVIYKWAGQFFWLGFQPNGRLLAFTGRTTSSASSEVWVIENLRDELKLLAPPAPRRTP
jgi:Tol biopolymer transport system component